MLQSSPFPRRLPKATQTNFSVAAMFDADKEKIGQKIGDVEIFDIKDFARIAKRAEFYIQLMVPPTSVAQSDADEFRGHRDV